MISRRDFLAGLYGGFGHGMVRPALATGPVLQRSRTLTQDDLLQV